MPDSVTPRHALVPESAAGRRLDAVVAELFPEYSRSRLSAWIKSGDVTVDGGTARAVAHTVQGYYASLHTHQTTAPFKDRMMDFDGLNALIGTPELMAQGRQYE